MAVKRSTKTKDVKQWPPKWERHDSWERVKRVTVRAFKAHGETRKLAKLRRTYYFRLVRRRSRLIPLATKKTLMLRGEEVGGYWPRHPDRVFAPYRDQVFRFSFYYRSWPTPHRAMVWFDQADSVVEIVKKLVGREWRAERKPKPGLDYQI